MRCDWLKEEMQWGKTFPHVSSDKIGEAAARGKGDSIYLEIDAVVVHAWHIRWMPLGHLMLPRLRVNATEEYTVCCQQNAFTPSRECMCLGKRPEALLPPVRSRPAMVTNNHFPKTVNSKPPSCDFACIATQGHSYPRHAKRCLYLVDYL